MTSAPWSFAIWIEAEPTPEPPACTRTLSPGLTPQRATSMCPAVTKTSGTQAATTKERFSGFGMRFTPGTAMNSA